MPNDRLLRNCIALSILLHLTFMVLASMIRWAPHRAENVMVVDLADLPRSTEFLRPQPGIVEGARPKPPPPPPPKPAREEKPRVPTPRELVGRVPDLPVNPDLPPEKEFPVPRPPDKVARAEEANPAREAPPPPPSATPKTLREMTPSLGQMVMAKATTRAGRGEETSSGSAVGTDGKAEKEGAISEEGGGGAHLTVLNAPEIQYISYFASIKRKIELVWQYPQDAANAGIQGELTVDFIIGRDGSLESLQLLQGSGHKILDDEALGSIRIAAPYNPIPENYTIPNLRIRAHFIYEMHTLKIR
ncbi:MAG: energy transducer TonB [Deltaproteobacteria bacterium]|nr:energy transducer TonB [Deltaproteobacteria bacterium]